MMVYICGWMYFSVFLWLSSRRDRRKDKIFLIGTFFLVYFIYGMRNYDVGTDTWAYTRYFQIYEQYSFYDLIHEKHEFKNMEYGFILLCKIVIFFTDRIDVFLRVVALVYGSLYVAFLSKLKKTEMYWYAYTYYGLYVFCTGLNIMRQGLSMLLLLYAFLEYRTKNRKWVVTIFLVLSCLFHKSALLAFITLFPFSLMKEKILLGKFWNWMAIFVAILGCFLFQIIFKVLGISGYLDDIPGKMGNARFIIFIYLLVIFFISKRGYEKNECEISEYFFIETNMIMLLIMNFMSIYSLVFIRITTLLLVFCAMVPCGISKCNMKSKQKCLLSITTYIIVAIYFFHSLLGNTGGIVPFQLLQK